jgi:hypothetical protein
MLLRDVTMYWQYLTSIGFRKLYSDVWDYFWTVVTSVVLCWIITIWLLSVWFEIPRDFMDYQSYMGSSLRIWSFRRLFLNLCSYNLDGSVTTSADDLVEVDISNGDRPRPTFISAKLDSKCKQQITNLLKEYKDCFTWDYTEMPGLDRSIVEHRLPIKSGFRSYQQPAH